MKNFANYFLAIVAIALFANFVIAQQQSIDISQATIAQYCAGYAPTKKPVQIECCVAGDKTTTTVSFGARCQAGQQSCTENSCPAGTSECGAEN